MFVRICSPLLIVLILANPVVCQMRELCAYRPSDDCQDRCTSCPCEQCDDSRQKQEAPAKPCDCPGGSHCQCLSAGAVVTKAVELDDAQVGFYLRGIAAVASQVRLTLVSAPDHLGGPPPRGKANVGRIARCLCASWLF